MTTKTRPRKHVETADYGAMVRRMVKAYSRRVGAGDIGALADLARLRADVDAAIELAARKLHDGDDAHEPYSWTEIGTAIGISRQAARQRFGVDGEA